MPDVDSIHMKGATQREEPARIDPGYSRPVGGFEAIAWFVLLAVRGLLLWLVVPLALLLWLLLTPIRALRHRSFASPSKVIGWADLNLIAVVGQILIRPFGRPIGLTPWSDMSLVDHRVSVIDP